MNRLPRLAAAGLVATGLLTVGYARSFAQPANKTPTERPDQQNATPTSAIAHIHGAGDNKDKIKGTVTFVQREDTVRALVDVDGLTPGKHGIHIHEKTDLSDPELKGAGGHW